MNGRGHITHETRDRLYARELRARLLRNLAQKLDETLGLRTEGPRCLESKSLHFTVIVSRHSIILQVFRTFCNYGIAQGT